MNVKTILLTFSSSNASSLTSKGTFATTREVSETDKPPYWHQLLIPMISAQVLCEIVYIHVAYL